MRVCGGGILCPSHQPVGCEAAHLTIRRPQRHRGPQAPLITLSAEFGRVTLQYSAVVQELFDRPRRVGPLPHATHKGVAGHPGEGPYVVLYLMVRDETILQAAYLTFGCPAAIASASMAAELAEGRTLSEAGLIGETDIVAALGGLPEGKEHCPRLAVTALRDAVPLDGGEDR